MPVCSLESKPHIPNLRAINPRAGTSAENGAPGVSALRSVTVLPGFPARLVALTALCAQEFALRTYVGSAKDTRARVHVYTRGGRGRRSLKSEGGQASWEGGPGEQRLVFFSVLLSAVSGKCRAR